MSKAPPIPAEQRTLGAQPGAGADLDEARLERRDAKANVQSGQPGDADVNLKEQGRYGNLAQNVTTVRASTQDR